MHVSKLFSLDKLQEMIDGGFVAVKDNPVLGLKILDYTSACQYAKKWNEVTLNCRGLIVDNDFNIVARPFPKFFNIEEHSRSDILFSKEFIAFEKVDGSMGVLYPTGNPTAPWAIATRGSFTSPQALKGTSMLANYMSKCNFRPDPDYTYIFEIIYPENRIVVDYGGISDLIFLCAIHKETGANVFNFGSTADWPYNRANIYPVKCHPRQIHFEMPIDNAEGYVLYFPSSNKRVKAKFDEYVRLHRIVTGVSTKTIWETLMTGGDFAEILDNVPDEFYNWVRKTEEELRTTFTGLKLAARTQFLGIIESKFDGKIANAKENRKEFALAVANIRNNGLLFKFLDGKSVDEDIWKSIKPEFARPFNMLAEELAE